MLRSRPARRPDAGSFVLSFLASLASRSGLSARDKRSHVQKCIVGAYHSSCQPRHEDHRRTERAAATGTRCLSFAFIRGDCPRPFTQVEFSARTPRPTLFREAGDAWGSARALSATAGLSLGPIAVVKGSEMHWGGAIPWDSPEAFRLRSLYGVGFD